MMKKIGVLYLEAEHFQSEANKTIGLPIVGPDMEQLIANRRAVDGKLTESGKKLQKSVISYFKTNYGIDVILRWSRRAGCSCPCSPGFVIKTQSANYWGRLNDKEQFNVWVDEGKLSPRIPRSLPFRAVEHALAGLA